MKFTDNLALVDTDLRRRAALCFALRHSGHHVEPHDSVAELAASPPRGGFVLVHDDPALLEAVLAFAAGRPALALVAYHERPDPRRIVHAVRAGARDYLACPFDPELLRAILAGPAASRPAPDRPLTPREREVLEAAAAGLPSRAIGERLAISRRTVDAHRVSVLHKMGVRSIAEAIGAARSAGIIAAPDRVP